MRFYNDVVGYIRDEYEWTKNEALRDTQKSCEAVAGACIAGLDRQVGQERKVSSQKDSR